MTYLPPLDRRCQIKLTPHFRCVKEGTHWRQWPECGCENPEEDVCIVHGEQAFWVCEGPHLYEELIAGEGPIRDR